MTYFDEKSIILITWLCNYDVILTAFRIILSTWLYNWCFTVTSTEGLTATCAAALGLPNLQGLRPSIIIFSLVTTMTR